MEHDIPAQSERLHGAVYEELHERRQKIQAELASIALKEQSLIKLAEQKERQETTLFPVHVLANHYRYVDEGYVGGFVERYPGAHLRLNCSDMSLAYMLALANLPESMGYSSGESLKAGLTRTNEYYGTADYTDVSLLSVIIEDTWERPTKKMRSLWKDASNVGRDRLAALLDEVIADNPYKAIPIRINTGELYDAMLRKRIFELCEASDLIEAYTSVAETESGNKGE